MLSASPIHQILDLARWAPSGDNTQPWQFEIVDECNFVIYGRDTRADCVYDLDGRASQLSLGALIETIDIAAAGLGLGTQVARRTGMPDTEPTFDVSVLPQADRTEARLVPAIPARRVFRRPMSLRAIGEPERRTLNAAVGPDHELLWFGDLSERLQWASLLWSNAGLRLRLPEAFEVHRRVIQWHARFSPDRIPDQALGAGPATLAIMRLAMSSWARVNFLNTWLGGTIGPRLEMDWIPALACGAHIAIVAKQAPQTIDDQLAAGRAVQRFWLTATQLGLQHQPAVTPLIFSRYLRDGLRFTSDPSLQASAVRIQAQLELLLGQRSNDVVWLGRLGHGAPASSRSERKLLAALLGKRPGHASTIGSNEGL
jgi:nitroreductase